MLWPDGVVTLRARIALLFGLLGLAASVLVGLFAFNATRSELTQSTDDFLRSRAVEIVQGVRRPPVGPRSGNDGGFGGDGGNPGSGSTGGDVRFDRTLLAFDADAIVQTIDENGMIVSSADVLPITDATISIVERSPGRTSNLIARFEDVDVDGEPYRMVTLALPSGGAVQVARSVAERNSILSALLLRFSLIAALVTAVGAALGWLIARRTTAPLRRLTTVASDVATTHDFATSDIDLDGARRDEIGRLASSFRTMLVALEESREQQHRLVHDAGHELRTPLTSLRANVEMLERAPDLPAAERAEIVRAIKSELVELGDLFTEMVDLATDQRETTVDLVPVDLDTVIRDVAERWQRRSERPIVVDSSSAIVAGDAALLERALTNLLGNAHKFSPPGEPIEVLGVDGTVRVRDRGPGVPDADRARIFDRFYRNESTRSMPGSGLGLAIVAQIVERHGGHVFVDDAPGGGAEIGFAVPLLPPPDPPPTA